jgi:hypothetical protein
MDFRRTLPEIRWQSCLSPVPSIRHPKGFRISADYPSVRGLLGMAKRWAGVPRAERGVLRAGMIYSD